MKNDLRNRARRLLVVILWTAAGAAWAGPGDAGGGFLDIPVGAQPASLGGAYAAAAADAYAPVYNPSALPRLAHAEAAATRLLYVQGASYDFLSVAVPAGRAAFGAAAQMFRLGDFEATDLSGRAIGSSGVRWSAYSLSAGLAVGPSLSFGATGKTIVGRIDGAGATALAADFGALYQAGKWRLAAVAANLGQSLRFLDAADPLPAAARFGAAYQLAEGFTASLEGSRGLHGGTELRGGFEWGMRNGVSLRTGYRGADEGVLERFSAGAGLEAWGQRFDYAWVPNGELGGSHYLSLLFRFGGRARPAETAEAPSGEPAPADEAWEDEGG